MTDTMDIMHLLTNLGLDEKESLLYSTLLKYQGLTILELSKLTGIPRSTVYRLCNDLQGKGFMEIRTEDTDTVHAVRPHGLNQLILRKEAEFNLYKASLEGLAEITEKQNSNEDSEIRTAYYSGEDGYLRILHNTLNAEKDIILMLSNELELSRNYLRKIAKTKLQLKILVSSKRTLSQELLNAKNSEIRVSPFSTNTLQILYTGVYVLGFGSDKSFRGMEIENKQISAAQGSLLQSIWNDSMSEKVL